MDEVREVMQKALDPEAFRRLYADFAGQNPLWNNIPSSTGLLYQWDETSTYIQEPPFFAGPSTPAGKASDLRGAKPLAIFGDSVTTDHITPPGPIKPGPPAAHHPLAQRAPVRHFHPPRSPPRNDRGMT